MEKLVNGVKHKIGLTDFELGKLSLKASEIYYKSYVERIYNKGTPEEHKVYLVSAMVKDGLLTNDIEVRVTMTEENLKVLEALNFPDRIDFEVVVISHRAMANNNYGSLVQTFKAEKIVKIGANVKN